MGETTINPGRRISYDGVLCTVRCKVNSIPGTSGAWLGVEWDNPERGKHDGTHAGVSYFECRSTQPKIASFVRPTRKPDPERTVLEAITAKYVSNSSHAEAVVISGKVAEEIGFDKVSREQSVLADLKLVVLDHMCIGGVAQRGASESVIKMAQKQLAETCPNIAELDLGHNPIETWAQVEDICAALPKLRTLRLNCLRLRDFESSGLSSSSNPLSNIEELHLNECLLRPSEIINILQNSGVPRLKSLKNLWLSQNELATFDIPKSPPAPTFATVKTLMLENNSFTSLDLIPPILSVFPNLSEISLQSNRISSFGTSLPNPPTTHTYSQLRTLNLTQNDITSWNFVDRLTRVFPNLSSLRLSKNPLYDGTTTTTATTPNQGETSYYLTLARIPSLQFLNHAKITSREREEGEIYFLSVAEKDIRSILNTLDSQNPAAATDTIFSLITKYPRYEPLCRKHDHDNLITAFQTQTTTTTTTPSTLAPSYSSGSLLSRLVTSTFYIPTSHPTSSTSHPTPNTRNFTRSIPSTIPTSSIFSLVARTLSLPALSFRLIYESEELDPSREDTTTYSQLYDARKDRKRRWDDWGDWDVDGVVEGKQEDEGGVETEGENGDGVVARENENGTGRWTDEGVWVKDGKKWRKREVVVLFGPRGWGEWLEKGVRECRIRVEPGREQK